MIISLIKRYRVLVIASSLASALGGFATMWLISLVYQQAGQPRGELNHTLVTLFFVALGASFLLGILSDRLLTSLSSSFVRDLRLAMVRRVLATRYQQLERVGGHKILVSLKEDIGSIAAALSALPQVIFNFTVTVSCLTYLWYLSPSHFLVLIVVLVLAIGASRVLLRRMTELFTKLRGEQDELFRGLQALVDGGKELGVSPNRRWFHYNKIVKPLAEAVRDSHVRASFQWNLSRNWSGALVFVAIAIVVFLPDLGGAKDAQFLVGCVLVITYLTGPISYLMNAAQPMVQGVLAARRVELLALSELGEIGGASFDGEDHSLLNWNRLVLEGVCFQRPGEDGSRPFRVGPVDLEIRHGELLFIAGSNGSGKSTFGKLLVGLYEPTAGQIVLDGKSLDRGWIDRYRSHFGVVFSDFYLFDHVLSADGALAGDDEMTRLILELGLANKVKASGGRLSTTKLSQGQRRRLALLQAFIEDAPIFVFDEWAADQDPEFKEFFYLQLLPDMRRSGKTVVAITHDDRYFHIADRVLLFDEGMIVQEYEPASRGQTGRAFARSETMGL